MDKARNKGLKEWKDFYYDPEEEFEETVRKENSLEIAKAMLKDNKDISEIIKYTNLTLDEVNKLKNN